jgi:hypothetical protein
MLNRTSITIGLLAVAAAGCHVLSAPINDDGKDATGAAGGQPVAPSSYNMTVTLSKSALSIGDSALVTVGEQINNNSSLTLYPNSALIVRAVDATIASVDSVTLWVHAVGAGQTNVYASYNLGNGVLLTASTRLIVAGH